MIEHEPVRVSHVAAVAELADVFPKMLGRDVSVRAPDRPFQQAPVPLDCIGMVDTAHPLLRFVIDRAVRVRTVSQHSVCRPFIGAYRRAGRDVCGNHRRKGVH